MAPRKYRLGVLGLGEGRSIMSAALQSEQWELANVCDLNEELCKERLAEFNFDRYTTKYQDMLDDPDIDVIAIYTPDQLHAEHIRMALEAGKHVICTKPLMVTLDGANELLEIQKKSGKNVFVGQSSRFFEPFIHQRRDYLEGKHGELDVVEAYYIADSRWFLERGWSRQKGFSWLYNFMIHAVDLVKWYLPETEEVFAYGRSSSVNREYGLEVPDDIRVLVRDKQGRIGTIAGSYAKRALRGIDPSIACTLRGSKGTSRGMYSKLIYQTNFQGEGPKVHTFDDKHGYYFRFEKENHHAGEYQNYIEYFADCLDKGETPLPDLNEGFHTLAVMEAIERSMATGQPVKVSDILKERNLVLDL